MLQPKDTDWLNRYKNKTHIHAVYKKPTSDLKTKSDRMENYIPCKWEAKESWSSNPHNRQNDLKIENITRDKEGHLLHNHQGTNPRRHNNCKYICTQHRSISELKTDTYKHKGRN